MKQTEDSPAKRIEEFLNFLDAAREIYKQAAERVELEDKRKIDLEHEIEFSANYQECNRAASAFKKCRLERRKYKDTMARYQQVVIFFQDEQNNRMLNRLRQLLGKQRREEEYLNGERVYKRRA